MQYFRVSRFCTFFVHFQRVSWKIMNGKKTIKWWWLYKINKLFHDMNKLDRIRKQNSASVFSMILIRSVPDSLFESLIKSLIQYPTLEILHWSWLGVRTPNQFLWSISRVGYWIRDLIRDGIWRESPVLTYFYPYYSVCRM